MAHNGLSPTPHPPFSEVTQLCADLEFTNGQIVSTANEKQGNLPGQPYISLDAAEVLAYVEEDLLTPVLDELGSHLWLLATPKSSHISSLHDQIVRGRDAIISEKPGLHLVWIGNRVFIKPLTPYLVSFAFWQHYLTPSGSPTEDHRKLQIREAALGYLRTWRYLVRYESDFRLAVEKCLIPSSIQFSDFARCISQLDAISDTEVSKRYHYGELRLSRLNFWIKILLRKPYYHKVAWQYADYFAKYYAPILFIFGAASVILSAMQVGIGARDQWVAFKSISAWFSVATLALICVVTLLMVLDFVILVSREVIYAFKKRLKRLFRRNDHV